MDGVSYWEIFLSFIHSTVVLKTGCKLHHSHKTTSKGTCLEASIGYNTITLLRSPGWLLKNTNIIITYL